MTVFVTKEENIYISQAEYEALLREYQESQKYTTSPCSFEVWLRARKQLQAAIDRKDQQITGNH